MRFQRGFLYRVNWRPRGVARKPYDVTLRVRQTRPLNAAKARISLAQGQGKPERTYLQSRELELEIVLGRLRLETYRQLARRLGCSHVHCWRVVRRHSRGLLPMLPKDEQGLIALREAIHAPVPRTVPWWLAKQWASHDEIWDCILLTQEQKVQAAAEFDRREHPTGPERQPGPQRESS
jgi:hypothetical protein